MRRCYCYGFYIFLTNGCLPFVGIFKDNMILKIVTPYSSPYIKKTNTPFSGYPGIHTRLNTDEDVNKAYI